MGPLAVSLNKVKVRKVYATVLLLCNLQWIWIFKQRCIIYHIISHMYRLISFVFTVFWWYSTNNWFKDSKRLFHFCILSSTSPKQKILQLYACLALKLVGQALPCFSGKQICCYRRSAFKVNPRTTTPSLQSHSGRNLLKDQTYEASAPMSTELSLCQFCLP